MDLYVGQNVYYVYLLPAWVFGLPDIQWVQAHYCRTRGWVRGSVGTKNHTPCIHSQYGPRETQ